MTFNRHRTLVKAYTEDIAHWDWESFGRTCLDNIDIDANEEPVGRCYIGSVQSLTPSGKICAFWTTNQSKHDEVRDAAWWEALEKEATYHKLYVSVGEGSSDDVFVYRPLPIDDFVEAYMECALWASEISPGLPWDQDSIKKILRDCYAFMDAAAPDLAKAVTRDGYDWDNAGHDFFLTRNRHGAGFWDRGLGAIGNVLTEAAHNYGETFIEVNGVTGMVEAY